MKKVLEKQEAVENDRSKGEIFIQSSHETLPGNLWNALIISGFGGKIDWTSFNDSVELAEKV